MWAATCLSNPLGLSAAAVMAMTFGGSVIGAGSLERLMGNSIETNPDDLKQHIVTSLTAYTTKLKENISDISMQIYNECQTLNIMNANSPEEVLKRRQVAWIHLFNEKIPSYERSAEIITQTTQDLKVFWECFDRNFRAVILNIWDTGYRYKGERLREEVTKIYMLSFVASKLAKNNPSITRDVIYSIGSAPDGSTTLTLKEIVYTFPGGGQVIIPGGHSLASEL